MKIKQLCFFTFVFTFSVLLSLSAWAQTCTVNSPTVTFAAYSPVANAPLTSNATLTVQCQNSLSINIFVLLCLNLGKGSADGSSFPRQLRSGSNSLSYDLYQDPAYTQTWTSAGSSIGAPMQQELLLLPLVGAQYTFTIYGALVSNQTQAIIANDYQSIFNGVQATLRYQTFTLFPPTCSSMSSPHTVPFTVTVNAAVKSDCTISATPINFGASSFLNTALYANGTITVKCSNGGNYAIALNGGSANSVVNRKMKKGNDAVNYQLYVDNSYTTIWGDNTQGTVLKTGIGNGMTTLYTVYGSIPAQTPPAMGNYQDTITATISF